MILIHSNFFILIFRSIRTHCNRILIHHPIGDFTYQLYDVTSYTLPRWAFMKGHSHNDM